MTGICPTAPSRQESFAAARKKHVLVISHSCCTPINQQIYAEIQQQTGWRFTMITPDAWRDEFGNTLKADLWPGFDADLKRIPVWKSGNIILHGYRARMRKWLRVIDPDLVYMNHEPYGLATAQACWANQRSVQAPFGFYSCQNIRKHYPPPFSWLERMVYRQSSFALPITGDVAGVLRQKRFEGRITVCPLPLDPHLYHAGLRQDPPPALQKIKNAPVMGFVGRAIEAKGLRTLAGALTQIRDLDWTFVLVGNGQFRDEFLRLLDRAGCAGRIVCPGYVPHAETPRWLASMDLLVIPSETQPNWKEQFGRVIPEALACGAAVVGSDSGEIPRLLRESGGGVVFPERQVEALAAALRSLLLDPVRRQSFAEAGGSWVRKHISLPAVAAKMIAAFAEAMEPARKFGG